MYEIRGDARKRSFVVAFSNVEEKKTFIMKNSVFIGSQLFKIEDFHVGTRLTEEVETAKEFTARISYIRNSNTEIDY